LNESLCFTKIIFAIIGEKNMGQQLCALMGYKNLWFFVCLVGLFCCLLLKVKNCEHENEEKQFFMDMMVYFNHHLNL
jgi:FtsH-binding integral membrane protein